MQACSTQISFGAIASDECLLAGVLAVVDLRDWCTLEGAARWAQQAVHQAHPALRRAVHDRAANHEGVSLWHLCKTADVTSLWARLGNNGEMTANGIQVLQDGRCGGTPLHVALGSLIANKADAARLSAWFLSRPSSAATIRKTNLRGQTPLHLCAKHNHVGVARRILALQGDAMINNRDNQETTPLVQAVREEHNDMVNVLLAGKADPNVLVPNCHGHGDTPLILAVRLKNPTVLRQLLEAPGIDLHMKSMDDDCPFGSSALDFAQSGPIRRMMEDAIDKRAPAMSAPSFDTAEYTAQLPLTKHGSKLSHAMSNQEIRTESWQKRPSCESESCAACCIPTWTLIKSVLQGRRQHS